MYSKQVHYMCIHVVENFIEFINELYILKFCKYRHNKSWHCDCDCSKH